MCWQLLSVNPPHDIVLRFSHLLVPLPLMAVRHRLVIWLPFNRQCFFESLPLDMQMIEVHSRCAAQCFTQRYG